MFLLRQYRVYVCVISNTIMNLIKYLLLTTLLLLLYPPLKGFSHRSDSHIREESSLLLFAFKGHLKRKAFEMVEFKESLDISGLLLIIGQTDSEFSKNDPKCAEAEGSYELNKFLLAE